MAKRKLTDREVLKATLRDLRFFSNNDENPHIWKRVDRAISRIERQLEGK